jgi:hypothetical protein
MSHYSSDPSHVRVDFFKTSGKWYETECVVWSASYHAELHEAFHEVLSEHLKGRMKGMFAVCLEPYNVHSHPIMVIIS